MSILGCRVWGKRTGYAQFHQINPIYIKAHLSNSKMGVRLAGSSGMFGCTELTSRYDDGINTL